MVKQLRASITQQQVGLELLSSQVSSLEASLRQAERPTAVIELPVTCAGHPSQDCARQSEEAAIVGREGWAPMCRGCGLDPSQSVG
jgi:hypothetical protein